MASVRLRALRHRVPRPRELVDRIIETLLLPLNSPGFIREGGGEMPAVALTFDDGPSPYNTPGILDLLEEHGAKATFFLVGERIKSREDILDRMVRLGHELGNHTYTHRHTLYLTKAELRDEIVKTNTALVAVRGKVNFVRPPFGKDRRRITSVATELGMRVALWSIDSGDASGYSSDQIVEAVTGSARRGSIVLLHDGGHLRSATLDACARVLPALREMGLELVTLSELVGDPGETKAFGGLPPENRDFAAE
jgi:peptidoglycan/xylan/chitin deacetylase (PgdA/CDA1 family)